MLSDFKPTASPRGENTIQAHPWCSLPSYKFYRDLKTPCGLTPDQSRPGKLTLIGGSEFLICSICLFPWCKYSFQGQFQATDLTSLCVGLGGRHTICPTPAPLWLPPLPVPVLALGFRVLPTSLALFLRGVDPQFPLFGIITIRSGDKNYSSLMG